MIIFSDALDRLKHELRVSKDQEVAALLGLGKTAFSERKKRESFPDREVRALSASRPELELDVDYIFSGQRTTASKVDPGQAGELAMHRLQASTQAIMRISTLLEYESPMVWTALIQELMFSHGLTEVGARRIMETLKSERKTA